MRVQINVRFVDMVRDSTTTINNLFSVMTIVGKVEIQGWEEIRARIQLLGREVLI